MKKYLIYSLILVTFIGTFSYVNLVTAQNLPSQPVTGCPEGQMLNLERKCVSNSSYIFLAPITTSEGGTGATFDPTDKGALGKYLNMMIKIVIGLSAVMAVMMFVIGGIEYMTSELVNTKESAKSRMTGAVLGLIIALGAYALLYTINPDLLDVDVEISNATITVDLEADVPQTYDPVTKKYKNGATFGNPWNETVAPNATLPPYVTAKQPPCTTVGQQNCTSIRGLLTGVVRQIQWGCECELVITGGSESWLHGGRSGNTTHQTGSATVDLRPNDKLNAYLSGGKTLVVMQRYPDANGPYLWEGDHWHIGR